MLKVSTALLLLLSSTQILSSDPLITSEKFKNISDEKQEVVHFKMSSNIPDEEREQATAFFSLDWKDTGVYFLEFHPHFYQKYHYQYS